ncbi:MAG: hypothetical protein WAT33_13255 [Giesbergeria sp.]|jgi:hypothetical protein
MVAFFCFMVVSVEQFALCARPSNRRQFTGGVQDLPPHMVTQSVLTVAPKTGPRKVCVRVMDLFGFE